MPTMRLKQPVFTYPDCVPFIKNKESIQKFKKKNRKYNLYLPK